MVSSLLTPKMFPDDRNLLFAVQNIEKLFNSIQNELQNISTWLPGLTQADNCLTHLKQNICCFIYRTKIHKFVSTFLHQKLTILL